MTLELKILSFSIVLGLVQIVLASAGGKPATRIHVDRECAG